VAHALQVNGPRASYNTSFVYAESLCMARVTGGTASDISLRSVRTRRHMSATYRQYLDSLLCDSARLKHSGRTVLSSPATSSNFTAAKLFRNALQMCRFARDAWLQALDDPIEHVFRCGHSVSGIGNPTAVAVLITPRDTIASEILHSANCLFDLVHSHVYIATPTQTRHCCRC